MEVLDDVCTKTYFKEKDQVLVLFKNIERTANIDKFTEIVKIRSALIKFSSINT